MGGSVVMAGPLYHFDKLRACSVPRSESGAGLDRG